MKGSGTILGRRNGPEKADAEARKPEAVVGLGGSGGGASCGAVVWSAVQEAFGAAHVDPAARIENPLRGSGQYFDAESGLHYNTRRYYDPRLGRYIQADPLGELADPSLPLPLLRQ